MNYRHIYHAGNFADIFKHLILTLVLGYLQNKDKGLFILDAFAGIGLYDLNSHEAAKTREHENGVKAFMNSEFSNPDLGAFQNRLKPFSILNFYPGSPLLIADSLRPQDRLSANELHAEDVETLKETLKKSRNSKVTSMDAYKNIMAAIPPVERRGLVLIDPPFERKDEFQMISAQFQKWIRRWATGCYMIWYPIKSASALHEMFEAAQDLDIKNVFVSELLLKPRNTPDSFNGCGVLILNAPYQIKNLIEELADPLCRALGGNITAEWLKES